MKDGKHRPNKKKDGKWIEPKEFQEKYKETLLPVLKRLKNR